jgi:hypothetical protein
MSAVFIIIEKGVYRHEVRGPYATFEAASDAARIASRRDDYHEWEVVELTDGNEMVRGRWQPRGMLVKPAPPARRYVPLEAPRWRAAGEQE